MDDVYTVSLSPDSISAIGDGVRAAIEPIITYQSRNDDALHMVAALMGVICGIILSYILFKGWHK